MAAAAGATGPAEPRGAAGTPGHAGPPMGWATFDPWQTATVASDVMLASHADAAGLQARQARRLAALLAAAAAHSPLYARLLRGRDAARLTLPELPVARKAALMAAFDDWVADPALTLAGLRRFVAEPARIGQAYEGRYLVWTSSGSSGPPAVFVQDAAALAVYDALQALRQPHPRAAWARWADPWFAGERIAFVGAVGGHFASVVANARLRRLNPALARCLHDISFLQPVAAMVAALNTLQPTLLGSYPSAALLLAEEQAAGRLAIAPRQVWTGGETLSPAERSFIAGAFGCPVVNSYGASEFFTLASECADGGLHLNSDWAVLEPVDARGRPVPPGTEGASVLLTNLANHVQPLIRYDLGDRVRLPPGRCACGSALPLVEVQGRRDDVLRLPARGGHGQVTVLPLAASTVLEEEGGLVDFQLVQAGPAALALSTPLRGRAAQAGLRHARDALADWLATQGAAGVRIQTHTARAPIRGPGGKVKRVVCAGAAAPESRRASKRAT